MIFMIVALALFAGPMTAEVDAETGAEQLAEMFSPILILTEETGGKWGDIIVTKPEPVGIMGARSADNLHFIRYVAAERRGARASEPDKDSWNRFTGIGIHIHEIGHLLGLEDAGTPALNFEARTVTQPVALAQAGPEGESGRNRSVERETQATEEGDSVQVETGEVEKEPVYLGHRIRGLGGSKHAAVRMSYYRKVWKKRKGDPTLPS